ncbi:hypothetical protein ACYSNU_00160 [Enterococcus sp. LJL120]
MGVKKFQRIARWLGRIFCFFCGMQIIFVLLLVLNIFHVGDVSFDFNPQFFMILRSEGAGMRLGGSGAELQHWIDGTTGLCLFLANSFVFYQGGTIFQGLAKGESPFSKQYLHKLKLISFTLIGSGLFAGFVHPFVTKFLQNLFDQDYDILYGLDSGLIYGLILYVVAGVIHYGIELQKLAEDTV